MNGFFGKYSRIIFGITLFLLVVIGVLGLSYLNTVKLQEDSKLVELSALQAALPQQLSKSLLNVYNEYIVGENYRKDLNEIVDVVNKFDQGVEDLNTNKLALTIGQDNLNKTSELWEPLSSRVKAINERLEEQLNTQEEDGATIQAALLELSEYAEVSVEFIAQILEELSQQINSTGANQQLSLLLELEQVNAHRISESVLLLNRNYFRGVSFEKEVADLNKNLQEFEKFFSILGAGGQLVTSSGVEFELPLLTSEEQLSLVQELKNAYLPLRADIQIFKDALEANGSRVSIPSLFVDVLAYSQSNANELSLQMQTLDKKASALVDEAADNNRLIQIGGLVASALIFLFILGNFFGNLRRSDQEVEVAQREAKQIFETVDQGLFLLNKDIKIGGQYSKELTAIFETENIANVELLKFLKDTVSESDLEKLTRYLKLLFDPKKKEKLIQGLNPLQKVSVQVVEKGRVINKFLRFGFSRVFNEDNKVESILTSVSDVTREALLQKQLEKESKKNEQQVSLLGTLLNTNIDLIPVFLKSTDASYQSLNEIMRKEARSSEEYKDKANELGIIIHKVKGESSALSIDMVTESCHEFEDELAKIQVKHFVDGNSFLPLVVILESLINYNVLIEDLNDRIFSKKTQSVESNAQSRGHSTSEGVGGFDSSYLFGFADKVAERLDKKVILKKSGLDAPGLPKKLVEALPALSSQFLRNSIAHGIEDTKTRKERGKPQAGKISLNLLRTADGFELDVMDDGNGIDEKAVITRALKLGLVTQDDAQKLSKQQIISLIFKPGFSIKDEVDEDSGRGMGMSAISKLINELNGRVSISTKVGEFTRFIIRFPSESKAVKKVA